jgi:putative addiction module component (TIGR02574 family)
VAQPLLNPPAGFDKLSVDEKIKYVESLWDSIIDGSELPVPDWHLELLRERLESYQADPAAGRPWSEVRAELQQRYVVSRSR